MLKYLNNKIIAHSFVIRHSSFVILLLALVIAAPALADKLEGNTYTIYNNINSGGDTLSGNTYVIKDSKGDALGGKMFGSSYTYTPGLFGLGVTSGAVAVTPPGELVDGGLIRQTNIVRNGNNLVLTWDYDPNGPYSVNIYLAAAAGADYLPNINAFTLLAAVPAGTKSYTHAGAANNGNNNYYRVLPSPLVAGTDHFDPKNNGITVGKVQIAVPANKYDFIALPFMEDMYLLSAALGEQLGEGGEYYFWDADAQNNPGATYAGGKWGGTAAALTTPLRYGDGFYVKAKTAASLALVGRFGKLAAPYVKALKPKDNYNLIAFSFPTAKDLVGMGVKLDPGADVYEWINYDAYKGATYNGTTWSTAGVDSLQLARPRFYRPISSLTWEFNP